MSPNLRRIIGFALLAVGVIGVVLAIGGMAVGFGVVDRIGVAITDVLTITSDSLNTTKATLEQTKTTIETAASSLENVEQAIVDASETVNQANGLAGDVFQIVSRDVPDTIDEIHAAIPPAAEAAKNAIEDAGLKMGERDVGWVVG